MKSLISYTKSIKIYFFIHFLIKNTITVIIFFMIELTSKQRKLLEKEGQTLSPVVLIGGAGVTEEQIKQIRTVIKIHELIKIKFNEFKDQKKELCSLIAENADSTLVRITGNTALFYKPAEEFSDRKYEKLLAKA